MATKIVSRPPEVHGCLQSWQDKVQDSIIRSTMSNGQPKVRRRFTGKYTVASVTVTLEAKDVDKWMAWFDDMRGGVLPSRFIDPQGKERVFRPLSYPNVQWLVGGVAARLSFQIEQLPAWTGL